MPTTRIAIYECCRYCGWWHVVHRKNRTVPALRSRSARPLLSLMLMHAHYSYKNILCNMFCAILLLLRLWASRWRRRFCRPLNTIYETQDESEHDAHAHRAHVCGHIMWCYVGGYMKHKSNTLHYSLSLSLCLRTLRALYNICERINRETSQPAPKLRNIPAYALVASMRLSE